MVVTDATSIQHKVNAIEGPRVLLYVDMAPRLLTYIPLYQALARRGYDPLLVVDRSVPVDTPDFADLQPEQLVSIESKIFENLRNVDLVFAPDTLRINPPADAVTVGIVHSLPDQPGLPFNLRGLIRNRPTAVRIFDYIVLPEKSTFREIRADGLVPFTNGLFPNELLSSRTEYLSFVPGGYPKVEFLAEMTAAHGGVKDCIVYAPTNSHQPYGQAASHGEAIVAELLERFPDYRIVIRPYPDDYQRLKFIERIAENDRVTIDRSLTGLEYQKRAAIVVTDSSSYAVTLSLATCRPYVSCAFDDRIRQGRGEASREVPEDAISIRVKRIEQLGAAIEYCIRDKDQWETKIERFRDEYLCNPGGSAAYLADAIPCFLDRSSRSSFIQVKRRSFEAEQSDVSPQEHIRNLEELWPACTPFQLEAIKSIERVLADT